MSDLLISPYTPGEIATFTPGRERQTAMYERLMVEAAGTRRFQGRIHVIQGARGVGKTSLLRAAERKARRLGLATVFVTATGEEGLALVGDGLRQELERLSPASVTDRFLAAISTLGVKLGPAELSMEMDQARAPQNAVANLQSTISTVARCTDEAVPGSA